MHMKYCTRIMCESSVVAEFFLLGREINLVFLIVQEKPSEARSCSQAWEVGDGQMDGRSVDVLFFWGLADTNLLALALLERSHCQVSSQLLIFNWKWQWWVLMRVSSPQFTRDFVDQSLGKDRCLPRKCLILPRLPPRWGSRSTRCS